MKKIILMLAFLVSLSVFAQTGRYIKNYDVLKYLPDSCDREPGTFWKSILENNKDFQSTMKKFDNPKGSAKAAKKKIDDNVSRLRLLRDVHVPTPSEERLDSSVCRMMFGDGPTYGMSFSVSADEVWNAYSMPDGHVCVNSGLIERLQQDPEMLCGVVAHEVCHYMYRHMLIHEYKSLKKEKQNMIGAAIGAVGTAIGNVAAASAGVEKDYSSEQYTSWFDTAREQSDLARYKYSREEEVEADIVAYRFLEWMGADPAKYIEALEKINLDFLLDSDDSRSEHPTTAFRVELLRQLKPVNYTVKE